MSNQGEGVVRWRGEIDGPRVKFITTAGIGLTADSIIGFLAPAQARELAMVLLDLAGRCEQWEGLPGHARRDVEIALPALKYGLLASGPIGKGDTT